MNDRGMKMMHSCLPRQGQRSLAVGASPRISRQITAKPPSGGGVPRFTLRRRSAAAPACALYDRGLAPTAKLHA
ncbi:MAG: hypothetical protein ACREJM_04695, partial [Candidatus Saccharimonadales bacterium]